MKEVLYGRNAVRESLLAGRRRPLRLLLAEGIRETGTVREILILARRCGIAVARLGRGELRGLGDVRHQGVGLETSPFPFCQLKDIVDLAQSRGEPPLLLLLDLLQDPQNAGSLLRTAEAVGVHGAVLQRRRAVGITPGVVNASAGAVEHVLVAQVTNLVNMMNALKKDGVWIGGLEAVDGASSYLSADLSGPLALVVGSEGQGMRRLVREKCDFLLRLPMHGDVTSLNAAVAGSIVLYEVLRQREAVQR
ncbi:MAG: 23S rRNA (guanosine(2251)-2'-O)-methyltransferase RlmB [Anaerolineales bacterium]|nr:MAG: 23S rRNA (guanosine(2251)-2'-O)-methyltransferase RlmB [Anaerolineales bacterium]